MQVEIRKGLSFFGVQGSPDRRVLKLNKQERAILARAYAICDKADDIVREDCQDAYNEFSYAASALSDIINDDEGFDIERQGTRPSISST